MPKPFYASIGPLLSLLSSYSLTDSSNGFLWFFLYVLNNFLSFKKLLPHPAFFPPFPDEITEKETWLHGCFFIRPCLLFRPFNDRLLNTTVSAQNQWLRACTEDIQNHREEHLPHKYIRTPCRQIPSCPRSWASALHSSGNRYRSWYPCRS